MLTTRLQVCSRVCGLRTVEFAGFAASDIRGLREQICTTYGAKVNYVRQVGFDERVVVAQRVDGRVSRQGVRTSDRRVVEARGAILDLLTTVLQVALVAR